MALVRWTEKTTKVGQNNPEEEEVKEEEKLPWCSSDSTRFLSLKMANK